MFSLLCSLTASSAQCCGVRVLDSKTQIYIPFITCADGEENEQAHLLHDTEQLKNLRKELEKTKRKRDKIFKEVQWLQQKANAPYYKEKVPLEVQQKDR